MNRNLNRRIHPIAEADGLSPKKPRKDSRNIPCGVSGTLVSNKDVGFRYFTIGELTKSETAERFGIDNTPTAAQPL